MNCIAMNDPKRLYTWGFYLIAMIYDLVTFCISCYHLLHGLPLDVYRASRFLRILVVDGMLYFVALTAVNILNLIVYRSKDTWVQSSAAPFGYLITGIMSQRILIHMRDISDGTGIHVVRVTPANLILNNVALRNDAFNGSDRDGGDETMRGFEGIMLRRESVPDVGKSFLNVDPKLPSPSAWRQRNGLADGHHYVRYPPSVP